MKSDELCRDWTILPRRQARARKSSFLPRSLFRRMSGLLRVLTSYFSSRSIIRTALLLIMWMKSWAFSKVNIHGDQWLLAKQSWLRSFLLSSTAERMMVAARSREVYHWTRQGFHKASSIAHQCLSIITRWELHVSRCVYAAKTDDRLKHTDLSVNVDECPLLDDSFK